MHISKFIFTCTSMKCFMLMKKQGSPMWERFDLDLFCKQYRNLWDEQGVFINADFSILAHTTLMKLFMLMKSAVFHKHEKFD